MLIRGVMWVSILASDWSVTARRALEFKLVESYLVQEQKYPFVFYLFLNKFLRSAHNLSSLIRHKILPVYSFSAMRSVPACESRQFYCFFLGGARGAWFILLICVCVDLGLLSVPKNAIVAAESALRTVCVLYSYVHTYVQLMPTVATTSDNQRNELYPIPQPEGRYKVPGSISKMQRGLGKVLILRP